MTLLAGIFRYSAGKKVPKTKHLNDPVRTVLTKRLARCTQGRLHRYHETIENVCDDGRCRLIFQQSLKLAVILPLFRCLVDWKWTVKEFREACAANLQIMLQ